MSLRTTVIRVERASPRTATYGDMRHSVSKTYLTWNILRPCSVFQYPVRWVETRSTGWLSLQIPAEQPPCVPPATEASLDCMRLPWSLCYYSWFCIGIQPVGMWRHVLLAALIRWSTDLDAVKYVKHVILVHNASFRVTRFSRVRDVSPPGRLALISDVLTVSPALPHPLIHRREV